MNQLFVFLLIIYFAICNAFASPVIEHGTSTLTNQLLDVRKNGVKSSREGRSVEEHLEDFLKSHEASFTIPTLGTNVTLAAKNLDNDEVDIKINFGNDNNQVESRKKKKSSLKKAFVPILIFVLIKAAILIPLALGILGFKTWNAIQLAFASFVVSTSLAIWKFCTYAFNKNSTPPPVLYGDYERMEDAQQIAYSAYGQTNRL